MNATRSLSVLAFATKHPRTRIALTHWLGLVKAARWANANEVQAGFSKAKVFS